MKLDSYSLQAQILPGVILILPVLIELNVCFIEVDINFFISFPILNIVTLGATFIIMAIVRHNGKKNEKLLFQAWGGSPTIRYLRIENNEFNAHTKELVKKNCKYNLSKIGVKKMPTLEDETNCPAKSDEIYEACVDGMRALTRDKKYKLVHAENRNYGMWRNLYGVKIYGIFINVLLIIFTTFGYIFLRSVVGKSYLIIFSTVNILFLVYWIIFVNKNNVKAASESYAKMLLETYAYIDNK